MQVNLIGNGDRRERRNAEYLRDVLQAFLGTYPGEAYIYLGLFMFGDSRREIDAVVDGHILGPLWPTVRTDDGDVPIKSFVVTVEMKSHDPRGIQVSGAVVEVQYDDGPSDASRQSFEHKHQLERYLKRHTSRAPFVYNLLWLTGVPDANVRDLMRAPNGRIIPHNVLPSTFDGAHFFRLIASGQLPAKDAGTDDGADIRRYGGWRRQPAVDSHQRNGFDASAMRGVYELFGEAKRTAGELTRRKLERLTDSSVSGSQYAQAIGDRLVMIRGRAGTGKTSSLLRHAYLQYAEHGRRVLFLTYNLGLVGDIHRLLALLDVTTDDDSAIDVMTMDAAMKRLMVQAGIASATSPPEEVEPLKPQLLEFVAGGLIERDDVARAVGRWDLVFVDECQDWTPVERDVLLGLYGAERVVVADGGADQVVRTLRKTDWRTREMHQPTTMRTSLRQSKNLVDFASSFAEHFNLHWGVEPNRELNGGTVDIYVGDVPVESVAETLRQAVEDGGCIGYDVLCLAAASKVKVSASKRVFADGWKWASAGLKYWDGIDPNERRDRFSADNEAIRVLPYESCRGLEGWAVICLDFDAFFEGRRRLYKPDESQLFAPADADVQEAARWAMIALTRPIHSAVIGLRQPSGPLAEALREVYEQNRDFVAWHGSD